MGGLALSTFQTVYYKCCVRSMGARAKRLIINNI